MGEGGRWEWREEMRGMQVWSVGARQHEGGGAAAVVVMAAEVASYW